MERVSHYRTNNGLTGNSISWGAMADVGYAARHSTIDASFMVPIEYTWSALDLLCTHATICVNLSANTWGMTFPMVTAMYSGCAGRFRQQVQARAAPRSSSFLKRSTTSAEYRAGV